MRLLLSCISTKHSVLKQHWTNTSQETQAACPLTVLGSYEKPKEDLGGLLCLIEDMGCSQQTIGLHMAAGVVASEKGVFETSFGSVHGVDADLSSLLENVVSSPLFNAQHSIPRTVQGNLVRSTGLYLCL